MPCPPPHLYQCPCLRSQIISTPPRARFGRPVEPSEKESRLKRSDTSGEAHVVPSLALNLTGLLNRAVSPPMPLRCHAVPHLPTKLRAPRAHCTLSPSAYPNSPRVLKPKPFPLVGLQDSQTTAQLFQNHLPTPPVEFFPGRGKILRRVSRS